MKWLHFILSHSIFIALCAAAISFQTVLICPATYSFYTIGFIFFSTICSYNAYWLISKNIDFNKIVSTQFNNVLLILFCFLAAAICFILSPLSIALLLPAIVLNGLYILPLLPFKGLAFTKKIGFLKTVVLALAWAYVTVVLPLNKPFIYLDNEKLLLFSYRFLFMLWLCILFDTRDIAVDKIKGLHSLATDSKPYQLKILVAILFLLMFCALFLMNMLGLNVKLTLSLSLSTLAVLVFYFLSFKKQGYLFYYFFVDGLMLFSALLTYVASI